MQIHAAPDLHSAFVGGIALGIVLAVMRLSPLAPLRIFATAYVDFFRSLPLVLLIFWFYFLVPIVGRPSSRRLLFGGDRLHPVRGRLFLRDHPLRHRGRATRPGGGGPRLRVSRKTQCLRHIVLPQALHRHACRCC